MLYAYKFTLALPHPGPQIMFIPTKNAPPPPNSRRATDIYIYIYRAGRMFLDSRSHVPGVLGTRERDFFKAHGNAECEEVGTLIHLTASWRAGKRVRPPLPRLGSARATCSHLVARCMCGGGESARHRGRGWDARQIFATNRDSRHSPPILLCAALV